MSKRYLYLFKEGHEAFGGDQTTMKNILGGKGAGLAEMTNAGMPVPQGFTITTEACTQYYADGREINDEIKADIERQYAEWKAASGAETTAPAEEAPAEEAPAAETPAEETPAEEAPAEDAAA